VLEAQGWTTDTTRGQLAGRADKAVEALQRDAGSTGPALG